MGFLINLLFFFLMIYLLGFILRRILFQDVYRRQREYQEQMRHQRQQSRRERPGADRREAFEKDISDEVRIVEEKPGDQ